MEQTLGKLKNWGCDMDGAISRVLDDEELLLSCIQQVAVDPSFEQLGKALEAGDVEAGFEAAHTLKGILANTGLTPLYDTVVQIVEPLRAKTLAGTAEPYQLLLAQRKQLQKILGAAA
ncbi:MAG: Hpt domain-containing protein [Faecalibacterium sp.]|jgi:HPt (histidine-containing phosphotransfer) domain-containing protein|nr:Hpt domain-containing protein [Faecalibacterium sp.]